MIRSSPSERGRLVEFFLPDWQVALIDAEDEHLIADAWVWADRRSKTSYVRVQKFGTEKKLRLHRLVIAAPPGFYVDHINGNGLDNRRSNLRLCTASQNNMNRMRKAGFVGVYFDKRRGTWRAEITVNRKAIHLGIFRSFEDALAAREEAEDRFQGEFSGRHR